MLALPNLLHLVNSVLISFLNIMQAQPTPIWQPSEAFVKQSNLSHFCAWLRTQGQPHFGDYEALWQWSIEQPALFWQLLAQYFQVRFHSQPLSVLSGGPMPHYRWFEGATLNYAEHVFSRANPTQPALLFQSETSPLTAITWTELRHQTAALAQYLRAQGVQPGDRVVGYLPNIPQATVALLATLSVGAVWSSTSPDFGTPSVVERFAQVSPKILIAVDGYQYGGKTFDKTAALGELVAQLPTLEATVIVPYLNLHTQWEPEALPSTRWTDIMNQATSELIFEAVAFEHPIWILYSSGTTGIPKAITHSHGGALLEHLKYLSFHNDVKPGERFFWFTTTGWMMWNFLNAALLVGATVVLYDGSPGYPSLEVLWTLAEQAQVAHFGTSAPYLMSCAKQELTPAHTHELKALRSIGSTGSPLPPEAYAYVYQRIKPDVWLCSMSGGTDVCTAWVGGNPWLPVVEGEIQSRCLGCALFAFDERGQAVTDEVGEMVVTQPMPSMPVFFWNDTTFEKYLSSYFDTFPDVWKHGDFLKISQRGSLVIYGRSDATLNRQGVRIGTAEIYRAVEGLAAIADSLVVNLEHPDGSDLMPLFVKMADGISLDEALSKQIKQRIRQAYSPRHVPDLIVEVPDIPYTISGKKMEMPVKKLLLGKPLEQAANLGAMRNPESLGFFVEWANTHQH